MPVSGRRNNIKIIAEAEGIHPYFGIGEVFLFTDPSNGKKIVLEVEDASHFNRGDECHSCKLSSLCQKRNGDLNTVPACISGLREDKKSVYFKEV